MVKYTFHLPPHGAMDHFELQHRKIYMILIIIIILLFTLKFYISFKLNFYSFDIFLFVIKTSLFNNNKILSTN